MAVKLNIVNDIIGMVGLAHKLSKETLGDMCNVMSGKEEVVRGPVMLMRDIERDLGTEGMAMFPPVDSEIPEEDKDKPVPNYPHNGYWVAKAMAKGGTRKVRAWYTWNFADATTNNGMIDVSKCLTEAPDRPAVIGGMEIGQAIDDLTKLIASDRTSGSQKKRYEQERTYWEGRQTTNRNVYEKAIAVWQHIELFRSTCDKLKLKILTDGGKTYEEGGLPTLSRKVFQISETANPEEYVQWSIGTFLGCNPEAAQADGGLLADLVATIGGEEPDHDDGQEPMKVNDLHREALRFQALLDQNNIAAVIKTLANKKDVGKILGHALVALSMSLDQLVIDADLTAKYEAVEKEAHDQHVTEAAAKGARKVG